jgi:hypothetical protein
METAVWLLCVFAAFVAGTFLGVQVVKTAVYVMETKYWLKDQDEDEDEDSESWKKA